MIAFLCNCCEQPMNMDDKNNVHMEIMNGSRAIETGGKYFGENRWSADLCSKCFNKIAPMIDKNYFSGNKSLFEQFGNLFKTEV